MGFWRDVFLLPEAPDTADHALAEVSWDAQVAAYMAGGTSRELSSEVAAIYRARTLTVDAMGSIPVYVDGNGRVPAPNATQTTSEFIRETVRSLVDCGDAYWRVSANGSVSVLKPSLMEVSWNTPNMDARIYTYNGQRVFPGVNMRVLSLDRGPEDLTGFGPMESDRIVGLIAEQRYSQQYYENNGNPTGILKTPGKLTQQEADKLKAQWVAARGVRTPAILGGGIEWSATSFSAQESEWVAAHQAGIGDAALLFGIPGAMMDYNTPGASLTYQNLGDLAEQWWRSTLYPTYARRIEEHMAEVLQQTVVFDPEQFFLSPLSTRANSARQLVDGGWNPDDVLDAVGLPKMRYRPDVVPTTVQTDPQEAPSAP